jgi:hypothetical protein
MQGLSLIGQAVRRATPAANQRWPSRLRPHRPNPVLMLSADRLWRLHVDEEIVPGPRINLRENAGKSFYRFDDSSLSAKDIRKLLVTPVVGGGCTSRRY